MPVLSQASQGVAQGHRARAMFTSPCTLAGSRPGHQHMSHALRARAALKTNSWGEDAPGTGSRHFPNQAAGGASEEDQRGFAMRSTAETYEMFQRLQQRPGQQGGGSGRVEFRRAGEGSEELEEPLVKSGPLTGKRRRPGLVNSVDPEEDGTSGFEMRSTAEVYRMFEEMQKRQQSPRPVEPHAGGDCFAG